MKIFSVTYSKNAESKTNTLDAFEQIASEMNDYANRAFFTNLREAQAAYDKIEISASADECGRAYRFDWKVLESTETISTEDEEIDDAFYNGNPEISIMETSFVFIPILRYCDLLIYFKSEFRPYLEMLLSTRSWDFFSAEDDEAEEEIFSQAALDAGILYRDFRGDLDVDNDALKSFLEKNGYRG